MFSFQRFANGSTVGCCRQNQERCQCDAAAADAAGCLLALHGQRSVRALRPGAGVHVHAGRPSGRVVSGMRIVVSRCVWSYVPSIELCFWLYRPADVRPRSQRPPPLCWPNRSSSERLIVATRRRTSSSSSSRPAETKCIHQPPSSPRRHTSKNNFEHSHSSTVYSLI